MSYKDIQDLHRGPEARARMVSMVRGGKARKWEDETALSYHTDEKTEAQREETHPGSHRK